LKDAEIEAKTNEWWNKTVANSKRGGFNLSGYVQLTNTGSFNTTPYVSSSDSGHDHDNSEPSFGNGFGAGLEIGSYFSFVPFTSFGIEVKGGLFDPYFLDDKRSSNSLDIWYINASPVIGVVLPLGSILKLFADGFFEIGTFGRGLKGVVSDLITYGYDFGIRLGALTVKYRGTEYNRGYVHTVVLGL
jgi:hypothetical protein